MEVERPQERNLHGEEGSGKFPQQTEVGASPPGKLAERKKIESGSAIAGAVMRCTRELVEGLPRLRVLRQPIVGTRRGRWPEVGAGLEGAAQRVWQSFQRSDDSPRGLKALRRPGICHGGPPPLCPADRQAFPSAVDRLLTRQRR
jgi:hypothetical protein